MSMRPLNRAELRPLHHGRTSTSIMIKGIKAESGPDFRSVMTIFIMIYKDEEFASSILTKGSTIVGYSPV